MGCHGSKAATAAQAPEVIPAVEGAVKDDTTFEYVAPDRVSSTDCGEDSTGTGFGSSAKTSTPSSATNDTAHATSSCSCCPDSPALESESAACLSSKAIAEAADLMRKHQVLQAEEVLARALARLEEAADADSSGSTATGSTSAAEAARAIHESETYAAVCARCRQYDELATLLGAQDQEQKLMWEDEEGSQLWVHAPAGESCLDFKVISNVYAPLTHCVAYGNEVDLLPEHEPAVVGAPTFLGEANPWHAVARVVLGLLLMRVEMIHEIFRFYNFEHGFLAESVRSDFDEQGVPVPPRHWRHKRIRTRSSLLWIPMGGGKQGTVVVQVTRVDAGFKIPDWLVRFFTRHFAPGMVRNLRENSKCVGDPAGPYTQRLAKDELGFYAECAKVERVAAGREAYTASSLPRQDWFHRPWRLQPFRPSLSSKTTK